MKAVEVVGLHVEIASGSPVLVLREHDPPHRILPLFIGATEAVAIALAVEGVEPPRPLTHDLLASLVDSLDAHVDWVEVTDVREGTYHAELAVSSHGGGERRIDSRPSDAIALALRVDAPMFVDETVLDEAGAVLAATPDDEIDEEVERFRDFLAQVDPSEFDPGDDPPLS